MPYWTMKDGKKINTRDMDINHLKNTLNMIVKNASDNREVLQFILDSILDAVEFNEFATSQFIVLTGEQAQEEYDNGSIDDECDATEFDLY